MLKQKSNLRTSNTDFAKEMEYNSLKCKYNLDVSHPFLVKDINSVYNFLIQKKGTGTQFSAQIDIFSIQIPLNCIHLT